MLLHVPCARSFGIWIWLKADAAEHEQAIQLGQPVQFYLLQRVPLLQPFGRFVPTNQHLLKLVAYPRCRLLRWSMAEWTR